ncbi:MAG: hypothetical protein Q9205_003963 [Flavoplaca limonia]
MRLISKIRWKYFCGDKYQMAKKIDELAQDNEHLEVKADCLEKQVKTLEVAYISSKCQAHKAETKSREEHLNERLIAWIRSLDGWAIVNQNTMVEQKSILTQYQTDLKQRNITTGDLRDRNSGLKGQSFTGNTAQGMLFSSEEIKNRDVQMKALKAGSGAVDNMSKTSTSAY